VSYTIEIKGLRIKARILKATAAPGTEPEMIAAKVLEYLAKKKPSTELQEKISKTVQKRQITKILHFTPIENLENILRFGLLPRVYIRSACLSPVSTPIFPDNYRRDGKPNCFCVSVSWPNYRMLSSKIYDERIKSQEWVLIEFNSRVLTKFKFDFYRTNAAKKESLSRGSGTFEELFFDPALRKKLALQTNFTTDPEAECMSEGNIPPDEIVGIHIATPYMKLSKKTDRIFKTLGAKKLLNSNLFVENSELFRARHDYAFWR
jgi:hypothetical protein